MRKDEKKAMKSDSKKGGKEPKGVKKKEENKVSPKGIKTKAKMIRG